jgi:hypothetical protein
MSPTEFEREIERLAVEAAAARARLAELREKLSYARAMMEDVRGALVESEGSVSEGTPLPQPSQER